MKTRVLFITLLVIVTIGGKLLGRQILPTDPTEGPLNYVGSRIYQYNNLTGSLETQCQFNPGVTYTFYVDFESQQVSTGGCVRDGIFDKILLKNAVGGISVVSVTEIKTTQGGTLVDNSGRVYARFKIRVFIQGVITFENELQAKIIYRSLANFCNNDIDLFIGTPFNVGSLSSTDFSLTRTQGTGTINCSGSEFYTLTNNRQDIDFGTKLTVSATFNPNNLGLTAIVSAPVGKTVNIEVKSNGTVPVGNYVLNVRVNRNACTSSSTTKQGSFNITRNLPLLPFVESPTVKCQGTLLQAGYFVSSNVQYATSYEWIFYDEEQQQLFTRTSTGRSLSLPYPPQTLSYVKVRGVNSCGAGSYSDLLYVYLTCDPFGGEKAPDIVDFAPTEDPQTLVYPNPASTELNVVVPEYIQLPATIQLVSPQGAIVVSKQTQVRSNKLDVSTYPEGLYLVQVTDGNQVVSAKAFIKR